MIMAFAPNGRGRFGPTFVDHPVGKALLDYGVYKASVKINQLTHGKLHEINKHARRLTRGYSIKPGTKTGVIPNSYVCNAYNEVSYKHQVSSTVYSSTADTKIHKNTFQVGVPTSKSLYRFRSNRVVDTERDYISTSKRQALTCTFGFNQRCYDFLLSDTFISLADYKFLFDCHKEKFQSRLANKNIYGNIFL